MDAGVVGRDSLSKGEFMIAVLLSHENHAVNGRPVASTNDVIALAFALDYWPAAEINALTLGALPESAARDFFAQGIANIEQLANLHNLTDACNNAKWIIAGVQAAQGSGMLPYQIAAALNRPLIDRVVSLTQDGESLHVVQALAKGARRHLTLTAPCVLTIHPQAAVTARYAAHAAAHGSIIGVAHDAPVDKSTWLNTKQHARTPLKAVVKKSGHARMLGAIGDSTGQSSTQVLNTDAATAARAVLDYLQQHGLFNSKG